MIHKLIIQMTDSLADGVTKTQQFRNSCYNFVIDRLNCFGTNLTQKPKLETEKYRNILHELTVSEISICIKKLQIAKMTDTCLTKHYGFKKTFESLLERTTQMFFKANQSNHGLLKALQGGGNMQSCVSKFNLKYQICNTRLRATKLWLSEVSAN